MSDGATVAAEQWLRRPDHRLWDLLRAGLELEQPVSRLDVPSIETVVKYEGYLKRQQADVARSGREENRRIPHGFAYGSVPGLSSEVVHRLTQVRPETLGQARRIPGITPAAIAVLATYVSRSVEIS